MAVDATGTPTSKGIPKFNPDADAPSGLGFNAAMDAIDLLFDKTSYSTDTKGTNKVPVWNGSAWVYSQITDAMVAPGAAIAQSKLAPIQIARIYGTATVAAADGNKQLPISIENDQAGLGTIVSNDWRVDVAGTYLFMPSMYTANLGAGSNQRVIVRQNPAGANTAVTEVYPDAGVANAGDDRWLAGVFAVAALAANDVIRITGANSEATGRQIDGHLVLIRLGA